jgi:F420-dependent oxidoreductase-like protein
VSQVELALNLGYWGTGGDADNLALAQEADRLGYSVVWNAEAYGSDSPTVLSWVAAQTTRIDVGSAVMQIPARTPTMTAMTAATLDALSGGRFRLGLGVSGPQVSEGWHGVRFAKPLRRTREYVDIVRLALSRQRVRYEGVTYTLPLPEGPGKALQLTVHPVREHIPIYLAAIGPRNLELAGEIADGWLAIFFAPEFAPEQLSQIAAGRAKRGRTLEGFDVVPTVPLVVGDDLEACATAVRNYAALYVGGMGSRDQNFYNDLAVRMGYAEEAAEVQRRYLSRDYQGAAAAVPAGFVDSTSLLGPAKRITERLVQFAEAGVTTLALSAFGATHEERVASLRTAATALVDAGLSERRPASARA